MRRCAFRRVGWAHPRSRGENTYAGEDRNLALGSSPLTRGKRRQHQGDQRADRLIPAHAGKTATACTNATTWGAHPRSRGENPPAQHGRARTRGSSPLTRGKQEGVGLQAEKEGLIPAHAGKTSKSSEAVSRPWAHPRSRGENVRTRFYGSQRVGSSPLTRGKLPRGRHASSARGLIPAHAGKTPRSARGHPPPGAHPRSRGENRHTGRNADRTGGSSPLTRGKPAGRD